MPREYYPESHRRSSPGSGARDSLHRNDTTSPRERVHTTNLEHQDIDEDANDVIMRRVYSARVVRPSLLPISRTERLNQRFSNQLNRERRRIDAFMQHLPETGQRSYMAEHDELRRRDHHRQHISWADGYEAGLAAARGTSLEVNMPGNYVTYHVRNHESERLTFQVEHMHPRPRGPPLLSPHRQNAPSPLRIRLNDVGHLCQTPQRIHLTDWERYAEILHDTDNEDEGLPTPPLNDAEGHP
ncbi:MAG: hypothetical protein Q9212_001523 [Teloschistes hypoglaucus]